MLKFIYAVIGIVVVLVGAILILAANQPDTFRIERKIDIKAAPDKVFAAVDDFHQWTTWSPWEHLDPNMKKTFSGPANGKGAGYAWEGNKDVGKGAMEITDAAAPSKIAIKLDFLAPFEAHNTTEFTFAPSGDGTTVTWAMTGPSPFTMKIMHVFISMDKMVGQDFEHGLSNLKNVAEHM
jgi:uncharacterized protein YndB with AHSA1/START domain